ncbi:MAG: hypothetical protein EA377_01250 [Phycisphaerales bacterium]|nr:MAG: hypothetical protein EA377_01250 [Phycisphaerales bacterium]
MKHKTWFRLVLKAIGILLIAWAIPEMFGAIGWVFYMWPSASYLSPAEVFRISVTLAGPTIKIAFGCYLLFGGAALVNWIIPSNHPYCPDCGYNLTHQRSTDRCVECGSDITHLRREQQSLIGSRTDTAEDFRLPDEARSSGDDQATVRPPTG